MITGIYIIVNKVNKKVYVGSATNIGKRWRDHKWYLNHNTHHNSHLQSSWNKYGGSSFEFLVVVECNVCDLLSSEKEQIIKYNALDKNYGYNINDPQKIIIGKKCSEETNKLRSKNMLGNKNPMFGKYGIEHPKFNVSPSIIMKTQLSLTKKGIPTHRRTHNKLKPEDISTIRRMYFEDKISQPKIAKKYNVCCTTINQIINNKIWTDVK